MGSHADPASSHARVPLARPLEVGRAIRAIRNERDMTQAELADAAQVSRKWLSETENGKASAELGLVLAVLHALDCGMTIIPRSQPEFDLESYIESFARRD